MQISTSDSIEDSDWDQFLSQNPYGHHEQSSRFATVRKQNYFDHFRLIAREGNSIVGGVQVLVRKTPIGSYAYISQGPVINENREDIAEQLTLALDQESIERKITKTSLYTCYPSEFLLEECQKKGFEPIQGLQSPKYTSMLDLTQDLDLLLSKMKKKTRYNIRYAEKNGIQIVRGNRSDIQEFYSTYRKTAEYKKFPIFPLEYFEYLWDVFAKDQKIILLLARQDGKALAGHSLMVSGGRIYSGWGGIDRDGPDTKANYLLQWEAIQQAKSMGLEYYDIGGISLTPENKEREFKQLFGGEICKYPEPLEKYYGKGASIRRSLFLLSQKNKWIQNKITSFERRMYGQTPY